MSPVAKENLPDEVEGGLGIGRTRDINTAKMTKITKEIIDKKQISVQLLRIKNRNFLGATNVKVLLQCESIS